MTRFWCHVCENQVDSLVNECACSVCGSDFIEEIEVEQANLPAHFLEQEGEGEEEEEEERLARGSQYEEEDEDDEAEEAPESTDDKNGKVNY